LEGEYCPDINDGLLFVQVLSRLCATSTTVTVLSTSPITEFQSDLPPNDLPLNFIRSLKTCAVQEPLAVPPLEQPNIVSGLPAQSQSHIYCCH